MVRRGRFTGREQIGTMVGAKARRRGQIWNRSEGSPPAPARRPRPCRCRAPATRAAPARRERLTEGQDDGPPRPRPRRDPACRGRRRPAGTAPPTAAARPRRTARSRRTCPAHRTCPASQRCRARQMPRTRRALQVRTGRRPHSSFGTPSRSRTIRASAPKAAWLRFFKRRGRHFSMTVTVGIALDVPCCRLRACLRPQLRAWFLIMPRDSLCLGVHVRRSVRMRAERQSFRVLCAFPTIATIERSGGLVRPGRIRRVVLPRTPRSSRPEPPRRPPCRPRAWDRRPARADRRAAR